MEPLILLIEPDLDERAAAATMSRAQRVYEEGARDISRVMRTQLTEGTQAAGKGFEELETKARRAYLGMQDAGDKVAAAERKHEAAKERGAANAEALGRRVERARLDEIQAIDRASAAYREYETAARSAGQAGEQAGESAAQGMRGAAASAASAGQDAMNNFASGFAGATALTRLGTAGGPIGIALAGLAAVGLTAGKVLVDNIAAGMATMATRDLFQTRLGVDAATMSRYGDAAGSAFRDAWGASLEDNMRAVQFAVQGGVIDRGASNAEIEQSIAQLQALSSVMGVDVQEAARASGQLIRGDFATSGTEAADIIVSGFQRGLDISGDWLDTITEYTTQFRKLGLDGDEALGLIQQGLQGGARDSDKVADSLKEFSIRAVDGSKLTAEGFAALGFNADDMAARFLAGGDSARQAFGVTLQAIQSIDDPIQQALTWQALFGTQWEDMGDAINNMDLSTARTEFGNTDGAINAATDTLSKHVNEWEKLGRAWDTQFAKLKEWLADSAIGRFFGGTLPSAINDFINPGSAGMGTGGYTNPNAPSTPLNPLDMLVPGAPGAPQTTGDLLMPSLTGPPAPGAAPPAGPAPVPGDRTPILTDTQREAADAAGGGTSLPGAPSLPLQYTSTAGMPTQVANAQTRLDEARHAAAEREARVNQLQQSNIATAEDIQKARNDLTKAERDRQQAEQALHDARISASEKQTKQLGQVSDSMGEMGAALDKDLGISKGLAGMADNLVRFLGSLAAAPLLGQLGAISQARGDEGSGMMGVLASTGALGARFMPSYGASASAMGPAAFGGGMGTGGYAGDAALLSNVPAGRYAQVQNADLTQGLADCSSAVEDLVNIMDGRPTGGRSMSTHNADEWLQSHGFLPGSMPGAFNVGFNSGHMQATLPGGTPFNWGSDSSAAARGIGGTGAFDPAFTSHYYRPVGPGAPAIAPTPGAGGPGWFPGNAALGGVTGGGGQSPVFGAGPTAPAGPGIGGSVGFPMSGAPGLGQSAGLGGQAYPAGPAGGGLGMSGGLMDAAMMGTSAMDMMMPGAGAAAKVGIQLANRTIKYAGQMAGIGVSGLLQTFTPAGDNPKASIGNSWFGKIAGGLAGAAPALPNQAGGKPPGAMGGQGGQQGQAAGGGNNINQSVTVNNNHATEDMVGNQAVRELGQMYAPAGRQ